MLLISTSVLNSLRSNRYFSKGGFLCASVFPFSPAQGKLSLRGLLPEGHDPVVRPVRDEEGPVRPDRDAGREPGGKEKEAMQARRFLRAEATVSFLFANVVRSLGYPYMQTLRFLITELTRSALRRVRELVEAVAGPPAPGHDRHAAQGPPVRRALKPRATAATA